MAEYQMISDNYPFETCVDQHLNRGLSKSDKYGVFQDKSELPFFREHFSERKMINMNSNISHIEPG